MPNYYKTVLKPRARKDLKSIPLSDRVRIIERMEQMEDNLQGDIKKLTNHFPGYRLRVGSWRVLFEIEDDELVVYRVQHRREACQ